MTILKVEEMHCNKCVERIHNALTEAKLVHEVKLEEKTVAIDGGEDCVRTAIEKLDDLGFAAEIVQ